MSRARVSPVILIALALALAFGVGACSRAGKTQLTECTLTCAGAANQTLHFEFCHLDGDDATAAGAAVEKSCLGEKAPKECAKATCSCTLLDETVPKDCSG